MALANRDCGAGDMRLRCEVCGCYVHANDEGYPYLFNSEDVRVEPCARCLREAKQEIRDLWLALLDENDMELVIGWKVVE